MQAECLELPTVDFQFGTRITNLHGSGDTVERAVLSDGSVLSAAVFVGAGSEPSGLHTWIGGDTTKRTYPHTIWTALLDARPPSVSVNRLYFSSSGRFVYFYQVGGKTRVFIGLPETDRVDVARAGTDLVEELAPFVTENRDMLVPAAQCEYFPMRVNSLESSRYHRGNAALLGSAVTAYHPMTGLGMSATLEDAVELAEVIKRSIDPDRLALMLDARYTRRRQVAHAKVRDYGDRLADSYPDRERYLTTFDPSLHAGDSVGAAPSAREHAGAGAGTSAA